MPYFGTVSSLLQSVDSHGLWGGLADGLPSTLGSARSSYAVRPHQCVGVGNDSEA